MNDGSWEAYRFEQLLSQPVRNGVYKPSEFHGRGAKIVNMGELFAHPRLRAVPMKRVEISSSEAARFLLAPGDLLFARRSLVAEGAGKCSVVLEVDDPTTFESSMIRARPDPSKADSQFLYYFFSSPTGFHQLDTIRRHVAVAGITGGDLSKLVFPVPPLAMQRAIAGVLSALDDKIELNRRMSATLEAMTRALFMSSFGEHASDEGDPAHSGWSQVGALVKQLRDVVQPSETPGKLFAHYSIPAFDQGDGPTIQRGAEIKSLKFVVRPGTLLLSKLNPEIDRTWLVDVESDELSVCSTEFLVLEPKPPIGVAFAYCLLRSSVFREGIRSLVTGTSKSHQRAQPENILGLRVPVPSPENLSKFEAVATPILERIRQASRESQTLAQLRDAALPKLMSNEIDLDDIRKPLEQIL